MTVHDIPDLQCGGGDLGSVVFSETFLESSINIQQKGKILIRLSLKKKWIADWFHKGNLIYIMRRTNPQVTDNRRQKSSLKQQSAALKIALSCPENHICDSSCSVCYSLAYLSASFLESLFLFLQMALCLQTAATPSWLQLCLAMHAGWYVLSWKSVLHFCDKQNVFFFIHFHKKHPSFKE